jgi:hypothetical protein
MNLITIHFIRKLLEKTLECKNVFILYYYKSATKNLAYQGLIFRLIPRELTIIGKKLLFYETKGCYVTPVAYSWYAFEKPCCVSCFVFPVIV